MPGEGMPYSRPTYVVIAACTCLIVLVAVIAVYYLFMGINQPAVPKRPLMLPGVFENFVPPPEDAIAIPVPPPAEPNASEQNIVQPVLPSAE